MTASPQAATLRTQVTHTWEKGGSGLVFYTDDVFWEVCKLAESAGAST